MDLAKLARDWTTEPNLRDCAEDTVEKLAERLLLVHRFLMDQASGPLGYLYQQQVRVNRELKEKLRDKQGPEQA